jgi:hypothetical protein
MPMSRALLAFNPETSLHAGNILLFGVAVPRPAHGSGLSAIEELNLASHFLEARSGPAMAALLKYIIGRSGAAVGQTTHPHAAAPLLQRLMRAAAVVRDALRSSAPEGSPLSPEGIFGTELEGLSPEDQEFETARRFVQFAGELTRAALRARRGAQADLNASYAERVATRRLAPGLLRALDRSAASFDTRSHMRLGR